ncbi:MAG: AMIN domain-containing protein [Pegethrix bostrychoides GSE-TBD4-15B]|jgi:type IV pilus assembly protein PilQ|uniref:AMIN domain-containing protein n=1 Tax=Pegethrix bostrychoides GSE-TBD4-15B TaxID=2839662 RepID=A0A951P7D5_9CYAN|nr:AMIN domain-containing protein [Pegethrix bostrychoides GSE-TBD4-15B]
MGSILGLAQPVWAAPVKIQAISIQPTSDGFELVLSAAQMPQPPQVLMATRQNVWTADLVNATLDLADGDSFEQNNPAPGIASIVVTQFEPDNVRIVVTSKSQTLSGELTRRGQPGITFNVYAIPDQAAASPSATPSTSPAVSPVPNPAVLVPDPAVSFSPNPGAARSVPNAFPDTLPRAIPPPVGDIAVATTDASAGLVNLETAEVVPRLVLRNAPVKDVLALLARAADLNLAFSDPESEPNAATNAVTNAADPLANREITVSLDIENESIQNVFNSVLQLVGLEANRRGRTIFVGSRLPTAARNLAVRSLRVNQVQVGVALNFLVAMGAESAVSRERLVTSVNAVAVQSLSEEDTAAIPAAVTQTQTTTEQRLETQRVDYQDSAPPLRGLLVFGDERTNMITLAGSPEQIRIATAQLVQLDLRRRQVAVNVRVIDINLSAIEDFSSSFSFGINDIFTQSNQGALTVNINDFNGEGSEGNSRNAFAAELNAQIQEGNAQVLTDPTLLVQEGQTATVAITEEVSTTTGTTTFSDTGEVVSFDQDDPRAAGLTLAVAIDRIDDNGFVSLSVAPTITAPAGQQENPDGSLTTLLSSRSLQSGQVRLRDGQTLILSGIIQDSDRSTVTKVPILGDIPILGALFRSTSQNNQRREVIVLLTPEILDESGDAAFGYRYTSDRDVQELLNRQRP